MLQVQTCDPLSGMPSLRSRSQFGERVLQPPPRPPQQPQARTVPSYTRRTAARPCYFQPTLRPPPLPCYDDSSVPPLPPRNGLQALHFNFAKGRGLRLRENPRAQRTGGCLPSEPAPRAQRASRRPLLPVAFLWTTQKLWATATAAVPRRSGRLPATIVVLFDVLKVGLCTTEA